MKGLVESLLGMVQKRKFQEGKSIDRRKKHGRCRYDIKQPTGRFCTYWNQKLDDKTCHKCESRE